MSSSSLLQAYGVDHPGPIHWNRGAATLYEEAIRRGDGMIAEGGPLAGMFTQNFKSFESEADADVVGAGPR